MNWTAAWLDVDCPLAKISNTDELCDAQTEIRKQDDDVNFWTALKVENGSYFWGNQPVDRLNSHALLDETESGNCYVISRDTMKLKSKDCNEVKKGLCSDNSEGLSESL